MLTEELPVYRKCVELISTIVDMSDDFPKKFKYSLYDQILKLSVTLLEPLEMANRCYGDIKGRAGYLETFMGRFNTIKTLVRICNEKRIISFKMAARVAMLTEDIGKQATAWKNR